MNRNCGLYFTEKACTPMKRPSRFLPLQILPFAIVAALAFLSLRTAAQTCQTADDMDAQLRAALTTAGQRYFDMAAKGDTVSLRQNSIPAVASDFAGIEALVKDRQPTLAGVQPAVKSAFLLSAENLAANQRPEFYCGVFGKNGQTADSAEFYIPDLQPGKYAVVLIDAASTQGRTMFSEVLQQIGNDWKLGGLYIRSAQTAGHNSDWFVAQARQFKARNQLRNAWFYYAEARSLVSPVPMMSTLATDRLYDEMQAVRPTDLPAAGKAASLADGAASYTLTAAFLAGVDSDLDLVVRHESANAGDNNLAYQENVNLIKALVTKFPELRDGFAGVVARSVDSSGHDYGTLVSMKDIK